VTEWLEILFVIGEFEILLLPQIKILYGFCQFLFSGSNQAASHSLSSLIKIQNHCMQETEKVSSKKVIKQPVTNRCTNFASVQKSFPLLKFMTVKRTFTLSGIPFTATFLWQSPCNHKTKYGNVLLHNVKSSRPATGLNRPMGDPVG
jgi:hypothetical protein